MLTNSVVSHMHSRPASRRREQDRETSCQDLPLCNDSVFSVVSSDLPIIISDCIISSLLLRATKISNPEKLSHTIQKLHGLGPIIITNNINAHLLEPDRASSLRIPLRPERHVRHSMIIRISCRNEGDQSSHHVLRILAERGGDGSEPV